MGLNVNDFEQVRPVSVQLTKEEDLCTAKIL